MEGMHKINSEKRYAELDVFRGLAIISVLLFHYTTRYNQIYGHAKMTFDFPYGYLGVQLFFMLSGFVTYMSMDHMNNGFEFIFKRYSRLFPAYWISILITFTSVTVFTLPDRQTSLHDVLLNLTMLQDWIGGVKSIDGAYWALSRFLSFYFLLFLIHRFNAKSKIVLICFLWLVSIFSVKTMSYLGIEMPDRIKITFLLTEGGFFIIGIMFYLIE